MKSRLSGAWVERKNVAVWVLTNRRYLKCKKLADLVQHKGRYRKPLQRWQTALNRMIGAIRHKAEQCFGSLKRRFHLDRSWYFSLRRTEAQVRWAAIGFNLPKAQRMLERLHAQPLAG